MDWQCSTWSACANRVQTRQCSFVRVPQHSQSTQCPDVTKRPAETQSCKVVSQQVSQASGVQIVQPSAEEPVDEDVYEEISQEDLSEEKLSVKKILISSTLFAFVLVLIISVVHFHKRRTISPIDKSRGKSIIDYVTKMRREGRSEVEIRKSLLKVGWDKETVDNLMKKQ